MKHGILAASALAFLMSAPAWAMGTGYLESLSREDFLGGDGTGAQVTAVQSRPSLSQAMSGAAEPRLTLITNGWVDVHEILANVAQDAGYSLQIAPDVSAQVNVHLEDVPLQRALQSMLDPVELGFEIVDNHLVVYQNDMITRWFSFNYPVTERSGRGELLVSGRSKQSGAGGSQDENESHVTTKVTMTVWPQVVSALQCLVFEGLEVAGGEGEGSEGQAVSLSDGQGRTLVINPMAGLVQVTAEWSRAEKVGTLLERLSESLRRQVAIEVKILEVTLTDTERTGIDWRNVSGKYIDVEFNSTEGMTNPAFLFRVKNSKTTGLVEAIQEQGSVKVLSTPRITSLNNQKAVVRVVTEEIFYEAVVEPALVTDGVGADATVEYIPRVIPVGIVLDVTPQIGQDRIVTLNVHPTISHIVRIEASPNQDTQPVISVRELDTVGKVRDGETLVIAGLMSEGFQKTESGIPVLMDIPLLGYLFKRSFKEKTKTELVMLLTPSILDETGDDEQAARLEKVIRGSR